MSATQRWGDQIAVETVNEIPYRMYTERPHRLAELLIFSERWGDRPYVLQGEQVLTFAQLRPAAMAKVAALKDAGVAPGDRVMLLGWNTIDWVVNFWACLSAGVVPVLANTWWSASEIERGLTALTPSATLADASAMEKMPVGATTVPWSNDALFKDGELQAPTVSGNEDETALIIFTSGTSGEPKAVILSHRAILARLHMTLHVTRKLPHQVDEAVHDVTLLTGPLFHVGNMQALLRAVVVGDSLVLSSGRYDPADVLALIERHKVNRWNAVPTMVSRLLDHPDVERRELGSLRSISIGGAPVHPELMQRMRTALPSVSPRIPTGYGLTENGGQATAAAGSEDISKLGSTGRPLPCVEIDFLAHPDLPDGEILLRSPTQMSGYFGLDQSPIDKDGWLHTGDLGRLDEKGQLWITGRCKDMIIRGGENIAPAAVERALVNIEGVSEAVVFGVPHADLGEEVMAVVVLDRELSEDDIKKELRGKLASFAVPSRWKIQHEPLPTNHTGKVDKKLIAARILEEAR